ncbi:MAG: hypothetical protein AAF447_14205 [Myxococcota bacterium]
MHHGFAATAGQAQNARVSESPKEDGARDGGAGVHSAEEAERAAEATADATPLDSAWAEVLAAWEDPGAHERFLALCEAMGAAAEAGARYRSVRDGDAERAADAQARLDQLVARALARLQLERSEVSPAPRRWVFVIALIAMACLLSGALRMLLG